MRSIYALAAIAMIALFASPPQSDADVRVGVGIGGVHVRAGVGPCRTAMRCPPIVCNRPVERCRRVPKACRPAACLPACVSACGPACDGCPECPGLIDRIRAYRCAKKEWREAKPSFQCRQRCRYESDCNDCQPTTTVMPEEVPTPAPLPALDPMNLPAAS